jgi:hypothetical protein
MEVVERSPLKSIIAINIRKRNGGTVLFNEGSQFLKVTMDRGSENVEYGRLLLLLLLVLLGFGVR